MEIEPLDEEILQESHFDREKNVQLTLKGTNFLSEVLDENCEEKLNYFIALKYTFIENYSRDVLLTSVPSMMCSFYCAFLQRRYLRIFNFNNSSGT